MPNSYADSLASMELRLAELEGVVERTERYVIVDKYGVAEALVADDPRGAQGS